MVCLSVLICTLWEGFTMQHAALFSDIAGLPASENNYQIVHFEVTQAQLQKHLKANFIGSAMPACQLVSNCIFCRSLLHFVHQLENSRVSF